MSLLRILDLVIGITFVYFLLSLICVALQEIKARWLNERAKNLRSWICDTLNKGGDQDQLGSRLWNNIIIDGLTQEGRNASYIPKEVFVSALLDEIHYGSDDAAEKKIYEGHSKDNGVTKDSTAQPDIQKSESVTQLPEPYNFETIRQSIERSELLPLRFKRVLRQIHSESYGNLDSFRDRLERWFDQAMERNAGTFKKKAQNAVFFFSVVMTIGLNVDSLKLMHYFYSNPLEAARVAEVAERVINDPATAQRVATDSATTTTLIREIGSSIKELKSLELPIGWPEWGKESFGDYFTKTNISIFGWLITIFAVSLGAPFWYDMLNKLVNIRSAGNRPESNPASPSTGTDTQSTDNVLA